MRRPPKSWFRRCVAHVKRAGKSRNARAVCGADWYRHMSDASRRRAKRKYVD
jgi:hypothetical protein